ncbi:MAG: Unknown protein [uncultured Sulfurovum sp.]|uniref:Uncharacterized protein n=1 Tax=uncultured Sulfurovum sp. TaxID=269237 RepID=A0A6S6TD05_9BACT|nr:MAG: Unknown protein [uncultured Sulfurovum sp.]
MVTLLTAEEIDNTTGLIADKGLGDVKENCTVCHTGRFIVVNGGDKKFWKRKIHIMQNAYGLWKIEKAQEERMLNYLSKNYSKKKEVSINE